MTITVRQRTGQDERLHHLLDEMRRTNRHSLPGTAARYIVRNQADPDEIELVLFWRGAILPTSEQRASALAALAADLAEVLDWEHATVKEGQVLLHAYA